MHLTEDFLKDNPNMYDFWAPSLDQDVLVLDVPYLGMEAAVKEWGQPKSNITHLIFCTCIDMPGADYQLIKLLGLTLITFRGPSETHLDSMVGQALFGDGADPDPVLEHPLFQLVSAAQTILPDSEGAVEGHVKEIMESVPKLISKNIENILVEAFKPIGIKDWNSLFWIPQPGGPAILDQMEAKLGLREEKLRSTRHVLREC